MDKSHNKKKSSKRKTLKKYYLIYITKNARTHVRKKILDNNKKILNTTLTG